MKRKYAGSGLQLVAGILMVLAGIISFFMPHVITNVLVIVLAVATLLSGISSLVFYYRNRNHPFMPMGSLFNGILSIVLGVLLFFTNSISLGVLFVYLLGGWLIIQSIFHIAGCVGLKRLGFTEWWLPLIVSLLGIVLAAIIFLNPLSTLKTVSIIAGIYLLIQGVTKIAEFFIHKKTL